MPTSRDVAKKAGVSVATISRVFNNPGAVSPRTREHVLSIAQELQYSPNYVARSLKSSKSNTIGIVIPDIHNPFYSNIITAIYHMLKSFGYNLLVTFSESDGADDMRNIKNLLSSRVEAIIFTPVIYDAELENILKSAQIYVLQLYCKAYIAFDSILIDDTKGMYIASETLLKNGHKKILAISDMDYYGMRYAGFKNAMDGYGNKSSRLVNINPNMYTEQELEKTIRDTIMEFTPTGIISVTSALNFATLSVLNKSRINYPQNISIINYDDTQYAELMQVTTIGHDIEKISCSICSTIENKLLKASYDPFGRPTHQVIDPKFIDRHSVDEIK